MSNVQKELGKEVGQVIDVENLGQRTMDLQWLHRTVGGSGLNRAGSWGFRAGTIVKKDMVYRFTVSGHHHKGHVYIELDFMDTFNINYTSNRGTIKKVRKDIYIDNLIEVLDVDIERIDDYVN
jgi:hypothetical protein